MGLPSWIKPYGLAVDAAGNAYVSITSYSSWLGDGDTEPLVPYHGERDGVALKLDKDGAYQWHAFYGSSGSNEYGYGIGLDSSADPFFMISSGASWLGPTGQSPLNPFGFSDQHAAVLKLGKNGAYQWHTFYPGWGEPSLTFDSDENIILIAQCAVYWTGPLGQAPINNPIGAFDMEIIKLSHAGVYQWHTYQGNSNTDWGWDTVTDGDANIYATGYSEATWNGPTGQAPLHAFTAGEKDLVVFKLNSGGSYQWHTFYGSAAKDESYNIEIDSEENLLVSGLGAGAWTGPVGQQPLYPYIGLDDITVINLSKDGLYRWHAFFGSLTGNDAAISIVADAWDDLYMVGYSGLSWNVGMIEPLNEHKLGGSDIPVLRLGYNRIFLPVIRR